MNIQRFACSECENVLTDTEKFYYQGRCEACEQEFHDAIKAWRAGKDDPKFDAAFGSPRTIN